MMEWETTVDQETVGYVPNQSLPAVRHYANI